MPPSEDELLARLTDCGVPFTLHRHAACMTVEAQDKKNRFYIISALAETKVDLSVLSARLGTGKGGLRFAPEEAIPELLQVLPGSVTPLAVASPAAAKVVLLLDARIKSQDTVYVHPLVNSASLALSPTALDAALLALGRTPIYVDLSLEPKIDKDHPPDLAQYTLAPEAKQEPAESVAGVQPNGQPASGARQESLPDAAGKQTAALGGKGGGSVKSTSKAGKGQAPTDSSKAVAATCAHERHQALVDVESVAEQVLQLVSQSLLNQSLEVGAAGVDSYTLRRLRADLESKLTASRSAQGKQRQDRRDGWATSRRQVIKVPEGAVLRGCKKTRRKLREHLRLRAEIHSQLRFIASLFVLRIFLTCLVGYPTPGSPSAPQPPAVQPPQPPDAPPLPPLPSRDPAQPAPAQPASMECDTDSDCESDCDSDPEPQSDSESESESEPEPVAQPPQRRCSARLAAMAPAAPTGPPLPLDCEDPLMLRQLKYFCMFFANPNFKTCYNQLQRRLVRNRHPMLMPAFEDPSNQALVAKLQELGSINFKERIVKLYAKAARAKLGWSGEEAQLFIRMACGYGINAHSSELKAATLDKGHVADLIEEANKHRRLLGMKKEGSLQDTLPLPCRMRHAVHVCRMARAVAAAPPPPCARAAKARQEAVGVHFIKVDSRVLHGVCKQLGLTKETRAAFTSQPALKHHWARWFDTNKLGNQGFAFERLVDTDGVSVCVHYTRPLPPPPAPPPDASSSTSTSSRPSAAAAAAHAVGLPHIGRGIAEMREFVFDPDTQIGVGIDPGVTQAVSAASGVWDPATGQLKADQLRRWKLTKGEVKHASGLNNARRDTERWLAPIKPHLQHLAAASPAGTSLVANLKHITVTLATWDAVWEVYLDLKWARQRLRLYGAQDRALEQFFNKLEEQMAQLSMNRHGRAKQLVVFFGAATIGTAGGWGADAVLRACRKVVCRPRGTDQLRGRVVLVDEHRTSRVSSAVNGQQPCEVELNTLSATRPAGWKPPAGQVEAAPVAPRKPPQAPRSSQAATQPAASEPGPSTPQPAKRSKRTKAEPAAEPTKGKGKAKGKAAKAKASTTARQRIGESRWRPLELCYWPDQGALPAKGKEYPGLGYKRLRDKPPKAQEQHQQPAEAQ
ncbi:hypothetical protein QJQ45_011805 [Haematococcus lacustris]|nr:hypothetical protein QJQ45_011805 [Haematococcus lacustris]